MNNSQKDSIAAEAMGAMREKIEGDHPWCDPQMARVVLESVD